MKTKSIFNREPAWVFTVSTAIISFFLIFVVAHVMIDIVGLDADLGSFIAYSVYGIFVVVATFFICMYYPKNIFYSILICNAIGIFPATGEQNFWTSSLWILFVSIWTVSILSGLLGSAIAKKRNTDPQK